MKGISLLLTAQRDDLERNILVDVGQNDKDKMIPHELV